MVRLATDADGPGLGCLFAACDFGGQDVDWTQPGISAWWWVAEEGGQLVGAIQVVPTRPWGYIGEVLVHPAARRCEVFGGPSSLTERLFLTALATLRRAGIQTVAGFVRRDARAWQTIIGRYAEPVHDGTLYHRRIA